MKNHIVNTTYRVTLNGYDFDFTSSSKAVFFMETAVGSFTPDRWHDAIHASMEVLVETLKEEPEEPKEVEEDEEVEKDDETAISG